ncbi:MAG: hypothetical protein ACYSRP_03940 [Planctomycetota bacterium]|jgi:hypothetical protein
MGHGQALKSLVYLDDSSNTPQTLRPWEYPTGSEGYMLVSPLPSEVVTKYEIYLPATGDVCTLEMPCYVPVSDDVVGRNVSPAWLGKFVQKLEEIKNLPNDWNGYGTAAPNALAVLNIWEVIEVLQDMDFAPAQISPSADEGITISFAQKNKYAFVECDNDGDILAATSDRQGKREIWQIRNSKDAIKNDLEIISAFINA